MATNGTTNGTKNGTTRHASAALAKPRPAEPPARHGINGRGPAEDIMRAFRSVEAVRDQWFLVAERVPNPNRYYDAFRGLGCRVEVRLTDKERGLSDVYALAPAGDLVPRGKPSSGRRG
jgi:hypothetical protein